VGRERHASSTPPDDHQLIQKTLAGMSQCPGTEEDIDVESVGLDVSTSIEHSRGHQQAPADREFGFVVTTAVEHE
jgi:hypothetical protein